MQEKNVDKFKLESYFCVCACFFIVDKIRDVQVWSNLFFSKWLRDLSWRTEKKRYRDRKQKPKLICCYSVSKENKANCTFY